MFGDMRVVEIDGEVWFCGKDVLLSLDYIINNDSSKHMAHVPDEWKGSKPIPTPGGVQEMLCLTEPGLYFFLGRSDKPKALPYQKWVAGEVIPSIRKTGAYINPTVAVEPDQEKYPYQYEFTEFNIDPVAYSRTLRQMARCKDYSSAQRSAFLAEAASFQSGKPIECYMPHRKSACVKDTAEDPVMKDVLTLIAEVERREKENLPRLQVSTGGQVTFGWGLTRAGKAANAAIEAGLLIKIKNKRKKGYSLAAV